MSTETIRIGIIGAGGNTRFRHIPGLQAIDGVEIVGVCNRSRASSERVADEFKIPRVFDNWREVIDNAGYTTVRASCIGCRGKTAPLRSRFW